MTQKARPAVCSDSKLLCPPSLCAPGMQRAVLLSGDKRPIYLGEKLN